MDSQKIDCVRSDFKRRFQERERSIIIFIEVNVITEFKNSKNRSIKIKKEK